MRAAIQDLAGRAGKREIDKNGLVTAKRMFGFSLTYLFAIFAILFVETLAMRAVA